MSKSWLGFFRASLLRFLYLGRMGAGIPTSTHTIFLCVEYGGIAWMQAATIGSSVNDMLRPLEQNHLVLSTFMPQFKAS